jgi:hypothetical protein
MDIEAALADNEAALAAAEQELAELTERIDALRLEKRGLELFVARHRGDQPREAGWDGIKTKPVHPWVPLARTDAILEALETVAEPLSPGAITDMLTEKGRTGDTPKNVSAALSYLQTQDKVRSLGRGRWVLAKTPLPLLPEAMRSLLQRLAPDADRKPPMTLDPLMTVDRGQNGTPPADTDVSSEREEAVP